jgi:hypothetical protein
MSSLKGINIKDAQAVNSAFALTRTLTETRTATEEKPVFTAASPLTKKQQALIYGEKAVSGLKKGLRWAGGFITQNKSGMESFLKSLNTLTTAYDEEAKVPTDVIIAASQVAVPVFYMAASGLEKLESYLAGKIKKADLPARYFALTF